MSQHETPTTAPKKRLHFGFLVVAAFLLTSFGPLSLSISCAGIFYSAVSEHLGVGAGTLSYYTSIIWASSLVMLPFLGKVISRVDARLCVSGAVAIAAADFVWLSCMQSLWQFFLGAFIMGASVTVLLFLAPSTIINRWFAKRAGFYIGLVMAFTGVGGVLWSSVGGMLIESIGWSATYLVFAAIALATLPTAILFVADSPEKKGLAPWGADLSADAAEGSASAAASTASMKDAIASASFTEQGMTAREAFRTPVFPLLLVMCFSLNFNMYMYFMIPSYVNLSELGALMPLLGATASSVAMAGQTISKVVLGYVGDRFPYAGAAVGTSFGVLGIVLFATGAHSAILIYLAAFTYGFYYGVTNVMMPILTRHSFGNRDYAQIYSRVSMAATLAGATAGFVWGTVIDAVGSFLPLFIGVGGMLALTVALIGALAALDRKQQVGK